MKSEVCEACRHGRQGVAIRWTPLTRPWCSPDTHPLGTHLCAAMRCQAPAARRSLHAACSACMRYAQPACGMLGRATTRSMSAGGARGMPRGAKHDQCRGRTVPQCCSIPFQLSDAIRGDPGTVRHVTRCDAAMGREMSAGITQYHMVMGVWHDDGRDRPSGWMKDGTTG